MLWLSLCDVCLHLHRCSFALMFLCKEVPTKKKNKVTDWIEYIGIYVFTEDIKSMKHVYHPSKVDMLEKMQKD